MKVNDTGGKQRQVIIKMGAANLDAGLELDFLRDDVDRSVKATEARQLGTQAQNLGTAG